MCRHYVQNRENITIAAVSYSNCDFCLEDISKKKNVFLTNI